MCRKTAKVLGSLILSQQFRIPEMLGLVLLCVTILSLLEYIHTSALRLFKMVWKVHNITPVACFGVGACQKEADRK